jgi:alkaline phosphatase D
MRLGGRVVEGLFAARARVLFVVCVLLGCGGGGAELESARVGPTEDGGVTPATRLRTCAICAKSTLDPQLEVTHGPLVGAVGDRYAKIWARFSSAATFAVAYWPVGEPDERQCSDPGTANPESDHTAVVRLSDLNPSTTYEYELLASTDADGGCANPLPISAQLTTLPEARTPGAIRFVTGADVAGSYIPAFDDVGQTSPHFVVLLGDNPYADAAEGNEYEDLRAMYHDVWSAPQFAGLFAETPLFMTWDDHEIMENYWKGKDDTRYEIARRLFDQYQGSHNPDPLHEGEIYYAFEAADVGFFVMDTRTHRSDNFAEDDANKSMLGARQKAALEEWLVDDRYAAHVIVSSVLYADFSTTGRDAWTAFRTERQDLFDIIAESGTRNAIVISGDQHWSAVIRNDHGDIDPYALFEFQATPIASGERDATMRRDEALLALDNRHNVFAVFDVDTTVEPIELTYTLCAVGAPCRPGEEDSPISPTQEALTEIPYTMQFRGGARGFELIEP